MFFSFDQGCLNQIEFHLVLSATIIEKKHYHSFYIFTVNKAKYFEVTEMNSGDEYWLIQVLKVALPQD